MSYRCILRVEAGNDAGTTFEIGEGTLVIGRASNADIRLRDTLVSRQHARVTRTGDQVEIENLSCFGTTVDDLKVESPTRLARGQRISLSADTTLVFESDAVVKTHGAALPAGPAAAGRGMPGPLAGGPPATGSSAGAGSSPPPPAPANPAGKAAVPARSNPGKISILPLLAAFQSQIIALVATVAILFGVREQLQASSYMYQFMLERSACQWLSLYAFLFGAACLLRRWLHWLANRRVLEQVLAGQAGSGKGMVWRRCHRIQYYTSKLNPIDLRTLAKDLADRDAEALQTAYTPVHDVIQMLPMIGFFGTVLGLSLGLNSTFAGGGDTATDNSFASAIATAFDTTLLALACTLALTLLQRLVHRREDTLLTTLGEFIDSWVDDLIPEQSQEDPLPAGESGKILSEFRGALAALCGQLGERIGEAVAEQGRVAAGCLQTQLEGFQAAMRNTHETAAAAVVESLRDGIGAQPSALAGLIGDSVRQSISGALSGLTPELAAASRAPAATEAPPLSQGSEPDAGMGSDPVLAGERNGV